MGGLTIVENRGPCSYPVFQSYGVPVDGERLHVHDLDGDGKVELVIQCIYEVSVMSFGPSGANLVTTLLAGAGEPTIYFEDMNGDGLTDIQRGLAYSPQLPDGTFGTPIVLPLPIPVAAAAMTAAVADFNADGLPDIVISRLVVNSLAPNHSEIDLYTDDGSGSFNLTATGILDPNFGVTDIFVADFDGDGRAEVVSWRFDVFADSLVHFTYAGGSGFNPHFPPFPQGLGFGQFRTTDFDGDGDLDLLYGYDGGLGVGAPGVSWVGFSDNGLLTSLLGILGTGNLTRGLSGGDLNGDGLTDVAYIKLTAPFASGLPKVSVAYGGTNPAIQLSAFQAVSGAGQAASQLAGLDQPVVLTLLGCDGSPVPFAAVSCSTSGDAGVATSLTTDALGNVNLSVSAGADLGAQTLTVTHELPLGGAIEVSFFVRGLEAEAMTAGGTTTLSLHYEHENGGVPIAITADLPAPPTNTAFGPLFSTLLAPGPGFAILDGIGLVGPPDASVVANPDYDVQIAGLPAPPAGTTLVFQAIAFDASYPYPQGVFLGAPRPLVF
ncbi:MAG: FG-GAP-like repeat-containing protein [Planctomycetota bacterium]